MDDATLVEDAQLQQAMALLRLHLTTLMVRRQTYEEGLNDAQAAIKINVRRQRLGG